MEKKKEDRRAQYSKRVIREALYELMREKPLNRITVKEICDLADVNRSTFYAYYADIYDLHTGIIREFYTLQRDYINRTLAYLDEQEDITDLSVAQYRQIAVIYLETVLKNRALYKFIFNSSSETKVFISFYKVFFSELRKRVPVEMHEQVRHAFRFVCGGTSLALTSWLERDCAEPVETMAKYLSYYYNGVFNGKQKTDK